MAADLGFTHVAFAVRNLSASLDFYRTYAGMSVVHKRTDAESGRAVAWLSDFTRPFVIVLVESPSTRDTPLGPFGHLGVACPSRAEVDRLSTLAEAAGCLRRAPKDSGPPVGYWAMLADPDGNTLELAHGQHVAFTVEEAAHLLS